MWKPLAVSGIFSFSDHTGVGRKAVPVNIRHALDYITNRIFCAEDLHGSLACIRHHTGLSPRKRKSLLLALLRIN
jgi:hypothetical protein